MTRVVTTILLCISAMLRVSHSDVYKSSQKIEDMVLKEEHILNRLYTAISETRNGTVLDYFSQFYKNRLHEIKELNRESFKMHLRHPNEIYAVIKSFSSKYQGLRTMVESSGSPQVQICLNSIADLNDLAASRMSILRLQDMYNLTVSNMIRGDYLGFAGPQLTQEDAWEIGQSAFRDETWDSAIEWLHEALSMVRQKQQPTVGFFASDETQAQTCSILALIGRAYIRQGNKQKAEEMYRQALTIARPEDSELTALEKELLSNLHAGNLEKELPSRPDITERYIRSSHFKQLCSLQEKLNQETFDRRLKCSYRPARPPYYRFKQELVSVSPYVVLFYDVVTQTEIDHILKIATTRLRSASVTLLNGTAMYLDDIRISELSFVHDQESPHIADMSRRAAAITGLKTRHYTQLDPSFNAEPFQVVNYGIGGHYDLHHDPFDSNIISTSKDQRFNIHGGNRLATFLIYLSDVEKGGSTVFPLANLAVKPIKKMGLFWYNYKPSGQLNKKTLHAACPVLIGHKWVTNKWIWLYGNTFTRRCGLRKTTNQLAIEKFMRTGWV